MSKHSNDFKKGYSQCCNDIVEVLDDIPENADKEYITHYLISELFARYHLMTLDDDDTTP